MQHFETRWRTAQGRELVVSLTRSPIRDAVGQLNALLLNGRDVTELQATIALLRASERRFRDLAESLPQMVWTCRGDGPCDYLGPQWVAYTGIPEAEQLGFRWLEQLHPDDVEPTKVSWAQAAGSGGLFDVEFRIRRHDGVYRWFKTRATPLRDSAGQITKWLGTNTDIQSIKDVELANQQLMHQLEARVDERTTELRNAYDRMSTLAVLLQTALTEQRVTELALRRAGAIQRAVVTSAGSAIIAADPEGIITLFNRAAEQLLGYSASELIGKSTPGIWHDLNEVQAHRAVIEAELDMQVPAPFDVFVMKSRVTRKPDTNEWTYICKDGTRVPVLLTISTLFDDDSNITGYLGVALDLTQRKQHEAELVQLNHLLEQRTAQAESASHAKGMFLANMSHEIRTPIGAIRGTTYLLGRTALSGEQADLVDTIERSAKILLGMVNDVLDLSKIEAQQLKLDNAAFALQDVIDDLASLMNAYAATPMRRSYLGCFVNWITRWKSRQPDLTPVRASYAP